MKTFFLAAALLQQEVTIPRTLKVLYNDALERCRDAAATLEREPAVALERISLLFQADVYKHAECRLRITEAPGELGDWVLYTPYQLRGRARVSLSRKDAENAARHLEGAVADFRRSVQAGIRDSEALLRDAEARLAALAKPSPAAASPTRPPAPVDPEPAFRADWKALLDAGRFRDARAHVEGKGAFLDAAKKKLLLEQTDEQSRRAAGLALDRYARDLSGATRPDRASLPDPAGLSAFPDSLVWIPELAANVLEPLARGEVPLEAALAAWPKAVQLDMAESRPWALGLGKLLGTMVEAELARRAGEAFKADAAGGKRLRAEADALRARWSPGALQGRHAALDVWPARFDAVLGRFPVEPPLVRAAFDRIEASFSQAAPEGDLAALERELAALDAGEAGRLAAGTRRELLSRLLAAGVLRRLLEGRSGTDVAGDADLRPHGRALAGLGGPVDLERYGTKVVRLVDALGR